VVVDSVEPAGPAGGEQAAPHRVRNGTPLRPTPRPEKLYLLASADDMPIA
jgi:hypothetical protein